MELAEAHYCLGRVVSRAETCSQAEES